MSRKWIPLAVIGGLVLIIGLFFMSRYNSLVSQREAVDSAWSQVENVLQRRSDLIPNLVETVKGYASHEKEVFTQIAESRAKLAGARTPAEAATANNDMSSALSRLLVIAEQYPDLKANENFKSLQDELAGTENRIAFERKHYNEVVRDYNTTIKGFPSNIVSGMFGFSTKDYFEADEAAKTAPKVNFH